MSRLGRWWAGLMPMLAAVMLLLGAGSASAAVCGTTSWTLWAGQTKNAGTLTVSNDVTNIYVTYTANTGWEFGDNLQVWVGNDLANLPSAAGNPVPGQFPYKVSNVGGQTTYTFVIPFTDLMIQDVTKACPLTLYVVAHADMKELATGNGATAFGGDKPGTTGNRWWYYAAYSVCCNPPPPIQACQTAFAKGGWVFTTDSRSNPENLPSLRLSKNRWGWAINLAGPGTTTYPIWAGAALNSTSKATRVGTLTVEWDGSVVKVTYTLLNGWSLKEVHVYAGDARPTTVAPGQYGYTWYFDPQASTHTESFALQDSNGTGGVWIIAHAVTCRR